MRTLGRVSVVVPAYFSYRTLPACLDALRQQSFRNFDVVVVNSSPESQTAELIMRFYPEVRIVQSPKRLLPHAARNRGAALVEGELLVFTDPDCRADRDWLAHLVNAWKAGHEAVGGGMDLDGGSWFECGVHLCKFWWALPGRRSGTCRILPTANAAYSRRLWNKIGPFEENRFCGDAVLSWRAARSGTTPWFESSAVVRHRHLGNFRSLSKERCERGQEFALERMRFEGWSKARALIYVAFLPCLIVLVLLRAAISAVRSGWGIRYVWTLPVQLVGQVAWAVGEARAHLQWGWGKGSQL